MTVAARSIKVVSKEEMRRIDEEAQKYGVDHYILMEDAGTAIYELIRREIGISGKRFLVIAGTGNNGGDALVAARRLYCSGASVKVFIVGDVSKMKDPARRMYDIVSKIGLEVTLMVDQTQVGRLADELSTSDVVIVGLIGIGLKGEITGLMRDIIEVINQKARLVISVDIPSGVDPDNGKIRGVAVRSHYTVTMGLPKIGCLLYPGYEHVGRLYYTRLSYPPSLLESNDIKTEINTPVEIPPRVKWGHKGTFGKLLAVAGSRYYYGAPYYSTYSFLKTGGGYARLASPKSIIPVIASRCSEIVFHPMEETSEGSLSLANYENIIRLVEEHSVDIVVIGPGISLNPETQELARQLVESINRPVIIDGDGITAISENPDILKRRKSATIITPHPVEFSRLLHVELKEIMENPVEYVRKTSEELSSYIVFKGAHTLIAYPTGEVFVNMTGNPGMAKAGMGDVLNGAIAGMYGIGLRDAGLATRMGVLVHGLAGDLVAKEIGEDGVTPDNVLEYLPRAVRILRENPGYIYENYMPKEL